LESGPENVCMRNWSIIKILYWSLKMILTIACKVQIQNESKFSGLPFV
jgi:hypothetical protein